jgi:hypothetical protein
MRLQFSNGYSVFSNDVQMSREHLSRLTFACTGARRYLTVATPVA